jgi:putative aldouronate transport system permease protein
LHEAAIVDGASKLQRIRHIEIPGIIPTATILLIMNVGRVMQIGFERAYLMQNPLNLETSEIIATYVYKVGLLSAQFSFSAAVGLFNSLINMILLISVNRVAKTLTSTSLW